MKEKADEADTCDKIFQLNPSKMLNNYLGRSLVKCQFDGCYF